MKHIHNSTFKIKNSSSVWAIINVTPDSFYAGSRVGTNIVGACRAAIADGANVLDIGGMSTRPGHTVIGQDEELARLDNALSVIKTHFPDIALSVDTYRSAIVRRLHAKFGKFIVNDIQGGAIDGDMLSTVAELGLDYVMMSGDADINSMMLFFERQIAAARAIGVEGEIMVDPGFGFGKTVEQNFAVLRELNQLKRFGRVFVGLSRKSMIFKTLGCDANDALVGTCALNWEALRNGASILRVHDVKPATDLIKLFSMVGRADV